MSTQEIILINPFDSLPRLPITSYEKKQQYGSIALLIIGGLGITAAAIGLARIGGLKNWWHADKLQALTQNHAIIMLSIGTPAGIVLITMSTRTLKRIKNISPESRPLDFTQITPDQFCDALMYSTTQDSKALFDQLFAPHKAQPQYLRFATALAKVIDSNNEALLRGVLTCEHATPEMLRKTMRHLLLHDHRNPNKMHQLLNFPTCTVEAKGAMLLVIIGEIRNNPQELTDLFERLLRDGTLRAEDIGDALELFHHFSHSLNPALFKQLLDHPNCPQEVCEALLLNLIDMPGQPLIPRYQATEDLLLTRLLNEDTRHTAISKTANQLARQHGSERFILALTDRIHRLLPNKPSDDSRYTDAINPLKAAVQAHRWHLLVSFSDAGDKRFDDPSSKALAETLRHLGHVVPAQAEEIETFLSSLRVSLISLPDEPA